MCNLFDAARSIPAAARRTSEMPGYSCNEWKAAGCSTKDLLDAGCSVKTCELPVTAARIECCRRQREGPHRCRARANSSLFYLVG